MCPNLGSPLEFGAAHTLVIFFNREYFDIFSTELFPLEKNCLGLNFWVAEKKIPPKKYKNSQSKKVHNMVSGSRFEWDTTIRAPFRKLKRFNRKLADFTAGVAPITYPKPIRLETITLNTCPITVGWVRFVSFVSRIPCFTSTTLLYHVSQSLIQYNLVLHL
jgi:hypothetical protein